MGDWQEVWDENTGCYYYWNTQSNEVTWELPPYLATQVQGLQHYQHRWVTPPSPRRGHVGMLLFLSLPFTLLFLSSTVAAANGSFVTTAELYPQEKGTAPGSVGRGATLAKREVKKVSLMGQVPASSCPFGDGWVTLLHLQPREGPHRHGAPSSAGCGLLCCVGLG